MNRKFKITLDGSVYEIENKDAILVVNNQEFQWHADEKGIHINHNPHSVEIKENSAIIDGIAYPLVIEGFEEKSPPKKRKTGASGALNESDLHAIMPGLIVKILMGEGEAVQSGDVVMILEAMKMQNEIRAGKAGILRHLYVKAGESVEMNQPLATIE